jgi:hypothetical protein
MLAFHPDATGVLPLLQHPPPTLPHLPRLVVVVMSGGVGLLRLGGGCHVGLLVAEPSAADLRADVAALLFLLRLRLLLHPMPRVERLIPPLLVGLVFATPWRDAGPLWIGTFAAVPRPER